MKLKLFLGAAFLLICAIAVFFFRNPYPGRFSALSSRSVYIRYSGGKYVLYRFGKPFIVKGGAGTSHLKELSEAGGNTIRVWDTIGLKQTLADAEANNIAVVVGLPMPYNDNMDAFYNNDAKVQALLNQYRILINYYKKKKAVLCWCLGNELTYPLKPKFYKFYVVFNCFVAMIHREDPDHPVTTTLINFEKQYLINIKLWTDIDFISFNIFGEIRHLNNNLNSFRLSWNGPFLITEWGIDGPWPGREQTVWGAFIESASNKKAEEYLNVYRYYLPAKNPNFLGSIVFFWGQKQETTPTWFSMFDKFGNKSQAVNVMQYLWRGKWPEHQAPNINYMLVDGKGARDNLIYRPNTVINAKVWMKDTTLNKELRFEWYVQPEDWFMVHNFYNQKPRQSIDSLFVSQKSESAVLHVPATEGPYRLYVNIYNPNGYFATCNTPFYVVEDKDK